MPLHRAVLPQTWAMIEAMEIIECDCEPVEVEINGEMVLRYPICEHVLQSDHGISLEEWAEILHTCAPGEYADPPTPPEPAFCGSKTQWIEVYRERYREAIDSKGNLIKPRYSIHHPGDLNPDDFHDGRHIKVLRNGAVQEYDPDEEEDYAEDF